MKRSARKFHRTVWPILGLLLPLIVLGAVFIKQTPIAELPEPVLLQAPENN